MSDQVVRDYPDTKSAQRARLVQRLENIGSDYYWRGGHWMTFCGWLEDELLFHDPLHDIGPGCDVEDYPGTGFDHTAFNDAYRNASANLFGKALFTLEDYEAGMVTVVAAAVSQSVIPEPLTVLGVCTGITFLARYVRTRRRG